MDHQLFSLVLVISTITLYNKTLGYFKCMNLFLSEILVEVHRIYALDKHLELFMLNAFI
jgi:hypothetical protein